MLLVAAFNPITAKTGTFQAQTLQTGCAIIVNNKTYVDVLFKVGNGDTFLVLANDRRKFLFNNTNAQPNPLVTWSQENIDYPQTVIQLENVCYVEIYQPDEIPDEVYPVSIAREPVPNLVPYNIGHSSYGLLVTTPSATKQNTIFPSSYAGVAIAPQSIGGLNYDHFYYYQNSTIGAMTDTPGLYQATGKTQNNATPNNIALLSYIPGPFSLAGLSPKDTASLSNGTYWTLASAIPWASSTTGFYIEMLVFIPQFTGNNMYLFADNTLSSASGVSIRLHQNDNKLQFSIGDTAHTTLTSNMALTAATWHHLMFVYTGQTDNNIAIYIDGNFDNQKATSGAITNSANAPDIGAAAPSGTSPIVGSICYLGINLSGIPQGIGLPNARYEHFQQSLNTDYQNAWIDRIDITGNSVSAIASITEISLTNLFNPAGLLYANTPASTDPLHIYNTVAITNNWFMPAFAANGVNSVQQPYTQPVTHYNNSFPVFTYSETSGVVFPSIELIVQGYNILGVV